MGLFDHLFKTKTPTGGEKMEEHAAEATAARPVEGAPKTPIPQKEKADPSAFLHPKSYVPRGATGLTPAPRPPASGISSKTVERRPAPASPAPAADEIVLTLGDVLSRIPPPYLKPGTHDAKRELRFKINDLSSDIARGRAAVPLSRIAQLVPDIFTREVSHEADMEIRLPLQKLVEQIGLLRSRPKTSVVEKIARPVTASELPPAAKPIVPIEVQKEPLNTPSAGPVLAAQSPVLEPLSSPAGLPSQPSPIILSEPVMAPKTVELKPSVESGPASAPVILGPPPVVEAPPIAPTPVPPVAPVIPPAPAAPAAEVIPPDRTPSPAAPTPEPPVLDVKPVIEPVKAALEPEPIKPAATPEPFTPSPSEKIVIDWGAEVAPKTEEKSEDTEADAVHDVVAETIRIEPAAEGPKLAPLESPDIDPSEEKIHLSLAAILRQCPREILVGEMPQVDDAVRITLPFAPIDRQLVKGKVEVSALRFIVALPEVYQKYFVAKVGVKVPIPLEEVFQNLPAPKQELTPAPPSPPPVVLAPSIPPRVSAPVVEKPEPPPVVAAPVVQTAPTSAPESVEPVEPVEPPAVPVEPPPLPVVLPVEAPKAEIPAAPAVPEEVLPAVAAPVYIAAPIKPVADFPVPVIPPIFDAPEPMTVEKVVRPPLPAAVEIAPSLTESAPEASVAASSTTETAQGAPAGFVPPWLSVEPAPVTPQGVSPVETPATPTPAAAAVPPIGLTPAPQEAAVESTPAPEPAPPSITSAEVNAQPSENAPRLKLQQPFFRPHFVPPPPIFGFTPPPATSEPEPVIKAEPPSVLASLTEAPIAETIAPLSGARIAETRGEVVPPAVESPAREDEPTPAVQPPAAIAAVTAEPAAEMPAPTSESEPSVEMIALAGEHEAPDIAHFSDEPVPFADLAETLAHETTYASDLAEVVQVDLPAPEPAETKAPAAAELPAVETAEEPTKPVEDEEHRPVPIVEGLAVAAVAATITEHVPLDFREVVAPVEEPALPEEAAEPIEATAPEAEVEEVEEFEPTVESKESRDVESLPVTAEKVEEAPAAETIEEEAAAEKIDEAPVAPVKNGEVPIEAPMAQTPAVLTPEPPAAAVPPPPPHPLFPLPKVHLEPAHVEVLPPPSLPLRRFDQDAVQALFMTEETLDLPKISRLAAALPGVYACVIATRDQACTGGNLPEGFDLAALLGLAPRVGEAAGRMPIGQLKHFTLYGDAYSVSFFERNGLSLCAVHRPRSFVPGVREKLVALADELSR